MPTDGLVTSYCEPVFGRDDEAVSPVRLLRWGSKSASPASQRGSFPGAVQKLQMHEVRPLEPPGGHWNYDV